jgi:hypothetical protein
MKAHSHSRQSICPSPKRRLLAISGAAICFWAVLAGHAEEKKEIAVVPMGTTQAYWKSVEAGAKRAY